MSCHVAEPMLEGLVERKRKGRIPPEICLEFDLGTAEPCMEVNPGTQVFALDTPPGAATTDDQTGFFIGTPTAGEEKAYGELFDGTIEGEDEENKAVETKAGIREDQQEAVQEFSAPPSSCSTPSSTPRHLDSPALGSHDSVSTCDSTQFTEELESQTAEKLRKLKALAEANEALLDDVLVSGNDFVEKAAAFNEEDDFGSDCELPDFGLGD
eukprot:TRINITY_DN2404_c1_g1_i11.p1 TRINITY_DN2404_c1_g1~~TRINITY_DN2404_c1_g1_i11.p1  ORF type:complete len:212 (-),score=58.59 TRINITY_DN2404_c1_g1_i11:623-1258(-)